ncbi:MAG: serine O-acetyltransferase [Alphaproteobacteria bacterium]|nr:serine O-acetyltransferase [Alphaproteobacteria bacterium]
MSPNQSQIIASTEWEKLQKSGADMVASSPYLANFGQEIILNSKNMAEGLSRLLSRQQLDPTIQSNYLETIFLSIYKKTPELLDKASCDLNAVVKRDPAAVDHLIPFLYFKGFHALQLYRLAHWLWSHKQIHIALFLQNRSSILYGVDIHPAAKIGTGIMLDHATGIVIGETSIIEDNVSLLHGVTLGGTGKEKGDRHPKIRQGVMIGAGAKILGNIEIGAGAVVAAGSVVLNDVPPHTIVAGVPAKITGKAKSEMPSEEMDQEV